MIFRPYSSWKVGNVKRVPKRVQDVHEEAHCREGRKCTGPGCNVRTGKTAEQRRKGR